MRRSSHWLACICRATPKAVRSQKALMNRWERVSVEEGIYAGIDALSEAYTTGEPQAAIKAFLARKKRTKLAVAASASSDNRIKVIRLVSH